MKKLKLLTVSAICFGFLSNVIAADDKAANIKNVEANYAKLYDMGLPHVKGAKYVKLQLLDDGNNVLMSAFPLDYELNQGAWLVKENPEGKSEFVIFGSLKAEYFDSAKIEKEIREKAKNLKQQGSHEEIRKMFKGSARWTNADLKQELKQLSFKIDQNAENDYGLGKEPASLGRLFILCAQAKENGLEKEYADFLNKIMELSDDPETLLKSAVLSMARVSAAKATADFITTADMKKYSSDLKDITKKYAGYCDVSSLDEVSAAIDKQLANPEIPKINGDKLTDEDKKIAEELSSVSLKPYELDDGRLWLIKSDDTGDNRNKVIEAITSRKFKSLPLLSALLGDAYLTNSIDSTSNFRISSNENREMVIASLPLTRGEIAKKLLKNVMFVDENGNFEDLTNEDIQEQVQELVKKFENKSEEQIAVIYLTDGNHSQKGIAALALARMAKDHNIPELEEFCLNAEDDGMMFRYYAVEYIKQRKSAAAVFAKKILEKIKEAKLAKKEKKSITETINSFISDEKYESFIDAIASGKVKAQADIVQQRTDAENQEAAALVLLNGIKIAKDKDAKYLFLNMLERVLENYKRSNDGKSEITDKIMKSPIWKELFADNAICESMPVVKCNEYAAFIYEIAGTTREYCAEIRNNLDVRFSPLCYDFYKLRALARLDGKNADDAAKIPVQAEEVPKEKVDEVIKALESSKSEKELSEASAKISFEYYNAVSDAIVKNQELTKRLLPFTLKIKEIRFGLQDEAVKTAFKDFEGQDISAGLLQKISGKVKELYAKDKGVTVYVMRNAAFSGICIAVAEFKNNPNAMKDKVAVRISAADYPVCFEMIPPPSYEASEQTKDLLKDVESYRQKRLEDNKKLFYDKFKQNIVDGGSPVFESVLFAVYPVEHIVPPKKDPKKLDSNEEDDDNKTADNGDEVEE